MDDTPRRGPAPLLRSLADFLTGPEMVEAVFACWPTIPLPPISCIPSTATDTEEADHE